MSKRSERFRRNKACAAIRLVVSNPKPKAKAVPLEAVVFELALWPWQFMADLAEAMTPRRRQ